MSKEMFIEAHEELIAEYMAEWEEAHPNATDAEWAAAEADAYDKCADGAWGRMTDGLADRIDHYRQLRKEGLL